MVGRGSVVTYDEGDSKAKTSVDPCHPREDIYGGNATYAICRTSLFSTSRGCPITWLRQYSLTDSVVTNAVLRRKSCPFRFPVGSELSNTRNQLSIGSSLFYTQRSSAYVI